MLLSYPEITIVGIDPSTDATGVALVRFSGKGVPTLLSSASLIGGDGEAKKGSLEARFHRIRDIKLQMMQWIAELHGPFDLVAYEAAFWRGDAASEAIPQASGSYLSIGAFSKADVVRVHGASVKAAYGNVLSGGKREDLKRNCIVWANQMFGLSLSLDLDDKQDAIADAIAVAVAAWRIWAKEYEAEQARQQLKAQRSHSRAVAGRAATSSRSGNSRSDLLSGGAARKTTRKQAPIK
jgi:Holliday junction resolvasome RuvABC endonuclease subunit